MYVKILNEESMIQETFPLSVGGDQVATEDKLLTKVEPGINMSHDSVSYIIIHCSATRETQDYTPEQLKHDHLARGFIDVGYHFYIRKDGTVTKHRRLNEVGAHCRPFNRCSIGVCYEGGLDANGKPKDTRTLKQRASLAGLLLDLHRQFPKAVIRGHCEMPGAVIKACPCFVASKEFAYLTKSLNSH